MTQKYDWRSLYIIHIISGGVFFASFSIVCLQWSSLLKLGSYVKALFGVQVIISINVAFIILDLIAIIMCARESSLVDFFESDFFYVYIFGDALKNLFFSFLLAFNGVRLVIKFYHYSSIDLSDHVVQGKMLSKQHSVFSTALYRLTFSLSVATACFFSRLVMLIIKSIALNSDDTVTSDRFPLFGFYWFCLSDFIPRILPSLSFILLMKSKRRSFKREMDTSLNQSQDLQRYTYLGDDEECDDNDDGEVNVDYFSDDEDSRSVSLFDPPPGSFIDDKDYNSTSRYYNYMQSSDEENDDESRGMYSLHSRVSDADVARERMRLEKNTTTEVSLTSFKNLEGGGDL